MWKWTFILFFFLFFVTTKCEIINAYDCYLPETLKKEISGYQGLVNNIIAQTTKGKYAGHFYNDLAAFVDQYGNRISGSKNLEESIGFISTKLLADGFKVKLDPVPIPFWQRGEESAEIIYPRKKKLNILGLGFSPGTNASGVTGDIMVVHSFKELQSRAKEVPGKIVVFNYEYSTYGVSVQFRSRGPALAGNLGAAAALVRSVTPFSINSPHTGTTRFGPNDKKIPAAAITLEDADMMARMHKAGHKVTVHLKMGAQSGPDATSHNLIADIPGQSLPNHYVTVSGHIDSWDVGQGALDDGVGAFLGLHTILLLKFLNIPPPKRTVRAILWTAEEQGLWGAKGYLEKHKEELKNWTAALESDSGLYKPLGLSFNGTDDAYCIMKEIMTLFKNLNATEVKKNPYVGSDISIFQPYGVPLLDPLNGDSNYMWFHHTDGDSMRTMNSADLDENLAIFAGTSYILANLSIQLPRAKQSAWDLVRLQENN